MSKLIPLGILLPISLGAVVSAADPGERIFVEMNAVDENGIGQDIGEIIITEVEDGLVFQPALIGLSRGLHGFHVHTNPDCGPANEDGETKAAGAAGGHLDPGPQDEHGAPWEDGHLGDLPALHFDEHESAANPVFKPGLSLEDVNGRALVLHEGGDNYANTPEPLGGGGDRMACGIISRQTPAGR